jgi:hypothetical protein
MATNKIKLSLKRVKREIKWKTKSTTLPEQFINIIKKIVERGNIDTTSTQIHNHSHSWRGTTNTQIHNHSHSWRGTTNTQIHSHSHSWRGTTNTQIHIHSHSWRGTTNTQIHNHSHSWRGTCTSINGAFPLSAMMLL